MFVVEALVFVFVELFEREYQGAGDRLLRLRDGTGETPAAPQPSFLPDKTSKQTQPWFTN